MLSLILSLAVSQTWQWANDPKYYSGPVIDYCRNGGNCSLSRLSVSNNTAGAFDSFLRVTTTLSNKSLACFQNSTNAVSLSRNSQYFDFGVSTSCGAGFTAYPLQIDSTSLRVITGSNTTILMDGHANDSSFPSPSTGKGFATSLASGKVYISDTLRWRQLGTSPNEVTEQRNYTFDWSDGTPVWITGNPQTSVFGPVARTVTCVGGSEASANQTYETVRTVPARVFTTGAVINNRCSEDFALTQRPYTVILGMEGIAGVNTTATVRWIYGFQQTAIIRAPTDAPINSGAWFRYSTSAGDTNYMACSSDGVTNSCTSTGVAANTALHEFRIDMRETGVVTYWIDGQARVRKTTNLPSAGTDLAFGIGTETLAASAVAANRPRFSLWYR